MQMKPELKNFDNLIKTTSLSVAALGLVVITGWFLNIVFFKSMIPGYISMKFNTAICLILLGSALYFHVIKGNAISRRLTLLFPLIAFVFGALSFAEELFHYNFGIDQLFISDLEINPANQVNPGRMSPVAAFCFILLSWVLLTIKSEKKILLITNQFFLHACTALSFIVILGYLFNTPEFYKLTFLTSMAIYTALAVLFLSIAASLINPTLGITGLFTGKGVGNVITKTLFLQMTLAIIILGYLRFLSHVYHVVTVEFGIALYTLSFILISFFLIWRTSKALNSIDLEKKNAEENLFSITMFLDLTPDPIIIADEMGVIQIVNNQAEAIFGYTRGELIGKKIELLIPNKFQKNHEHHRTVFFEKPKTRGMGTGLDLFAVKKNGMEFPVEISLSPIKTETGILVSAAIRDITIRKEEERKISQLATIIENSGDAIISKNLDGTILTWNKGAEKILGYTFDEVYGKHISFLFPKELVEEEKIIMSKILRGEYIDQYETIRVKKDQTPIQVSITVSPIKDKNGKVVAVSKILRDVTKTKEEEEKLRKYAILESKSKEMEQFAYVASHDLREPLLTIKNYMKLFLKNYGEAVDEESRRYIESVVKAADRMDVLIHSILDYSRLSQLKELEKVDTAILIKEIEADLNALISSTHAKIIVGPVPIIKAYPLELKLLFQNLITNAIKFRKKDISPEIHISASNTGSMWQFEVKDNGIGIADENKEKVFHMFKRLHSKNEYEGTGIGLAHCKKIVELHNGTIFIESQLGVGSTFKFTILT
jgi:PAS domain S-box-containing protein